MKIVHFGAAIAAVAIVAISVPAAAEDAAPYVGSWDCGIGVFTFKEDTYDPGDQPMPIADVEVSDNNFILTMEDGYQVGLSMNPDGGMSWLSMETGDGFDCTRLDK